MEYDRFIDQINVLSNLSGELRDLSEESTDRKSKEILNKYSNVAKDLENFLRGLTDKEE